MKLLFKIATLFGIVFSSFAQKTEIVVIGNVHTPMDRYNADTLYAILEKVKPDIILHELDHTFFTKDYKFKQPSKENEQNASERYFSKNPEVMIRPFEFEGRNEYRREKGIKQSESPTMRVLDSLYSSGNLTESQRTIVSEYRRLTDQLNSFGYLSALNFNNPKTDSISKLRQYYQHYEIRKVINEQKIFSEKFVTTSTGKKVSYKQGYNEFCDFWDLRNKTMAKNIIAYSKKYPNKKIVVLTGYFHRYYLLEELKKTKNKKFVIKEFYE